MVVCTVTAIYIFVGRRRPAATEVIFDGGEPLIQTLNLN
jgi:hypothetical protein